MAVEGGLSLPGVLMLAGGMVLTYSAVNDPVGGPVGVVRDVLSGRMPTPRVQTITPGAMGSAVGSAAADGARAGAAALGGEARSRVVAVAQQYLGTRYILGGASRSGMDCSGLVLVAYRDGAGIALPHRATLQAARGKRIPRDQVRPGDLVAWGAPGNYPHIALAVNSTTVIGAWTYGVPLGYGPIDQRAVPGFGLPDIYSLLP